MQALVTTIKTIKEEYLYPEKTSTVVYAAPKVQSIASKTLFQLL